MNADETVHRESLIARIRIDMLWAPGKSGLPPPLGPDARDEHEDQPEDGSGDERERSEFFDRDGSHERRDEHPGRCYDKHDAEGCRAHLKGSLGPDTAGHSPPGEGVEPGNP